MIETIRRLLDFSGRCRTDLLCAFGYGVLYSVSEVIPVLAIVVALEAVLSPSGGGWFAVAASGGLMGLSVAGKIIFGKRATERRMLASYDMCADKRIEVGEILKRVPLGYFSQNRLGELTATLTTTLGEIETNAVAILDKVANGFVHAVAITLLISWYDWHAGLITAAGLVVSLFVYGAMQRKGRKLSPVRQAAQSRLVAAVLEYVQGMAVVKAFGLGDRSNRAVDEAIERWRASGRRTLGVIAKSDFLAARYAELIARDYDLTLLTDETDAYPGGIVVSPVRLAKGLEFDEAVLLDADGRQYATEADRNLLYVAVTRAMHALTVLYRDEPSPLLGEQ